MTAPSKKEKRYDRQLRLWHAHGQQALESSKICLVNGTATGTEILKNLVLPGIGSFTVLDGKVVDGSDIGNNFFLDASSLGQSRAKCTAELLRELNDDVLSFHVDEHPESLIEAKPDFFTQFTVIITTQLPEASLLKLAEICWKSRVPLVVVRTYGFVGYVRTVVPEHPVIESHPAQFVDLRLENPFEEFSRFADSIVLDDCDSQKYSHIPYPVLLYKCAKEWKLKHGGEIPKTSAERIDFKKFIESMRKIGVDGENIDEAIANSHRVTSKSEISKDVERVMDDDCAMNICYESSNFWVMVRALREFVRNEGNGELPVAGVVPDMKSDTDSYVKIQTIYKQKARDDCAKIQRRVARILSSIDKPADAISLDEIDRFCRNAGSLRLLRYRSLAEEYGTGSSKAQDIARSLEDLDSDIIHYVLLRGVDRFYETHRRYPGVHKDDVEVDIGLLKKSIVSLLSSWQIVNPAAVSDDHIHEIVRAGAAEPHAIAAILGGIVAQEVIKIITRQYVPMNNTIVFNGIRSTSSVFEL